MPAEWEPHEATWLSWPHNQTTWPGALLDEVESIYVRMIRALLHFEKVHLLVPSQDAGRRVESHLNPKKDKLSNLVPHEVPTVDAWIRDYGPIFVKAPAGGTALTKWIFNAWGGKYEDLATDNGVVDRIGALGRRMRFDAGIVLEGGSIDLNGEGVCLTTEQCLLNSNRNASLSKTDLEGYLERFLGVRKVIWLKEGIEGDDTDGHVDDITRFVDPRTVLTAVEPDTDDPNHALLEENLRILKGQKDAAGTPLRILELPMPRRVSDRGTGERLPASYANFYIANGTVLVPLYGGANDARALEILREAFPGRRAVGIDCTALVHGLGSIHCVTQQEPR